MADIAKAYVQIIPSANGIQDKLETELSGASEKAGDKSSSKFASSFKKGLGTVGKVGAAALAATTTAVTAFGASAVSAGADFDSAMSQVAATMGYSMDELNDSSSEASQKISQLRDFAQQMGSTTAFSATEAAEALNYMALAGYSTETSMSMLPTVLDLAASGAMDLATASDMVTDVSSALGLSIDETTVMVDQMAAAASSSNTSVEQLGSALLTIGATAANVKGGTQELSTVLGALADNGIKGAEGGTHLRNMLLSLQDAAVDGKVSMGDFAVEVYDSEGNLRSMIDIIGDMQTGMNGMSQASKDALISGVFNKTDLASVNALLNTSSKRFDELSQKIGDSAGAASAMAEVQLDNLQGDVTLFKSALEGAKIAISDELTPSLRDFVKFGADGLSQLTEAFKSDGMEGAVQVLGDLIGQGLAMVIDKLPSFVEAGASLLTSLISGLLEHTSEIATSAMSIVNTLVIAIMELTPQLLSAGLQIIGELVIGIAEALPELIPAAISMIEEIGNAILDNLDLLIDAAMQLLEAIVNGIVNNFGKLMEVAAQIVMKLVNTLVEKSPELATSAVQLVIQLVNGIIANLPQIIPAAMQIINAINNAIISNLPTILQAGITLLGQLIAGIIQTIPQLINQIPNIISQMANAFKGYNWSSLGTNIIQGIANGIVNGASAIVTAAKNAAKSAFDAAKNFLGINSPSRLFRDQVGEAIPEGMALGIEQNTDYVTDAMKGLADDSVKSFDVNAVVSGSTYNRDIAPNGMQGAKFTLVESINLGDTKLKEIISQYTIQKVGNETRAVKVAQGGYY